MSLCCEGTTGSPFSIWREDGKLCCPLEGWLAYICGDDSGDDVVMGTVL